MKNRKLYIGVAAALLAVAILLFVIIPDSKSSGNEAAIGESIPTEPVCIEHADQNSDDVCDLCNQSVIIVIDFYCINDLHGRVLDSGSQPGIDEMTAFFQLARETDDYVVLLAAGDMWQGSAESNLTRGNLVTDWMSALDFAAMAVGNHEYDWGEDPIEVNAELAEFPLLAINIYDVDTGSRVDYCEASRLITCNGVQIGIIGAIGDCHSSIASEMGQGVYFKTDAELTNLVKQESEALRQQGADFIVYLLHDGLGGSPAGMPEPVTSQKLASYYDASLSDGYVDLVFEAHTHQRYMLQDPSGVLHLQNGGDNNAGITHVEVSIHAISGSTQITQAELISSSTYETLEDAPLIDELLNKYADTVAPALDICGTLAHAVPGDDLRQLIADLYYLAGFSRWGSEYPIALGGGFISIRNPGYLTNGEVTYAKLMELFPFDNELVLCSIQGRDLIDRFLEADDSRYGISTDPEIIRNIDANATYYVVVDTYTSTYGPNRLTEIERYGETIYARDLLADFIRSGGLN